MTRSIRYVASIDTSSANPDGSNAEDNVLILDAVPSSVLLHHQRDGVFFETQETIDFLLLRLNIKNLSNIGELEGRDLVCFNLSDTKPADDNLSYSANPIDFSFDGELDSNRVTFWVEFLSEPPSEPEMSVLKHLAEINSYSDASEEDCRNILSFVDSRDTNNSVGVYDVGQANLCSIVDENEHPLVFFDLGWPLRFNKRSIPLTKSFNPFALERDGHHHIPVILSHLDWDHWGYAYESGMAKWDEVNLYWKTEIKFRDVAIDRPWLLRRPNYNNHKLGPSHINFIQTLSKHIYDGSSSLNIWPDDLDEIYFKSFIVFKCKPTAKTPITPAFLRNNESLAMLVNDLDSNAKVLLCGDADYPSIPAPYRRGLTGIVAPHHGGKITYSDIPNAVGHGRMVFSTYPGCYNNVPSDDTEKEAKSRGWTVVKTSDRAPCLNRLSCSTGNKIIRLSTSPRCGCMRVERNCLCLWST